MLVFGPLSPPKLSLKFGERVHWMIFNILKWRAAFKKAQTQEANARPKPLQYNWLMHVYTTPEKFNKFDNHIPDLHFKSGQYKGTFFSIRI